eukprot:6212830-Pleurochrysis_carterae.AAC.4
MADSVVAPTGRLRSTARQAGILQSRYTAIQSTQYAPPRQSRSHGLHAFLCASWLRRVAALAFAL